MPFHDFFLGVSQIVIALLIANILITLSRPTHARFVHKSSTSLVRNDSSTAGDETRALREQLPLIAAALPLPPTDRKKLIAQYLVTGVEVLAPYAARDDLALTILGIMNDLGGVLVTVGIQESEEKMSKEVFAKELEGVMSRIKECVATMDQATLKVMDADED